MSLFTKISELENRIIKLELCTPNWIPLSKHFAKQYGYTLDGFRNYCLTNIDPQYFKKFDRQYHINKIALSKLKIK